MSKNIIIAEQAKKMFNIVADIHNLLINLLNQIPKQKQNFFSKQIEDQKLDLQKVCKQLETVYDIHERDGQMLAEQKLKPMAEFEEINDINLYKLAPEDVKDLMGNNDEKENNNDNDNQNENSPKSQDQSNQDENKPSDPNPLKEEATIETKLSKRYSDVIHKYKIESKSFSTNFDFETKLIELKQKEITDQIHSAKDKATKVSNSFNQVLYNALHAKYHPILATGTFTNQQKISVRKMLNSVRTCTKALIRVEDIKELKGVGKKFTDEMVGLLKLNFNINQNVIMMTRNKFEKSDPTKIKAKVAVKTGGRFKYKRESSNPSGDKTDDNENNNRTVVQQNDQGQQEFDRSKMDHENQGDSQIAKGAKCKKVETKLTSNKKLLRKLHAAYQNVEPKSMPPVSSIRMELMITVDSSEKITKSFDPNYFQEQFKALSCNVIRKALPIGDQAFMIRIYLDSNLESHQWILRNFNCFKNKLADLEENDSNEIQYDIMQKTVVERKAELDIEQSISDKRIFAQSLKMKALQDEFGMKNMIIVEKTNKNSSALHDTKRLVDIDQLRGVKVFVTDTFKETIMYIKNIQDIYRREIEEVKDKFSFLTKLKSISMENLLSQSFKSGRGVTIEAVQHKILKIVFKKGFNIQKDIGNFKSKLPHLPSIHTKVNTIKYKKQFNDFVKNSVTNSVKVGRLFDLFKNINDENDDLKITKDSLKRKRNKGNENNKDKNSNSQTTNKKNDADSNPIEKIRQNVSESNIPNLKQESYHIQKDAQEKNQEYLEFTQMIASLKFKSK